VVDRGEVPPDLRAYMNRQNKCAEQLTVGTSVGGKKSDTGASEEYVGAGAQSVELTLQTSDVDVRPSFLLPEDIQQLKFESPDQKMASGSVERQSFTSADYDDDSFLDVFSLEK
jgi:hypothetical protein